MFRIVALEDDPTLQKVLKQILVREGYHVNVCGTIAALLALLPLDKPDLVLMDVNLPDGNGIDACRKIKSDGALRHIPIILMTGEARSIEEREAGLMGGADDYILKPLSPKVLLARIDNIVKSATRPTRLGE